jgi:hypothetical protein
VLHLLNGDATATALAATDVPGERLVWRDLAMEGPATAVGRAPSAERLACLAAGFGIDAEDYARVVDDQTARLAAAPRHDEIVLWFEQDLFCAVTLWSLLDWFGREPTAPMLSLVYPALDDDIRGLGALTADRLDALFAGRATVGERTSTLGARAWAAYSSPDPLACAPLLAPESAALPFVSGAVRCHLGRFPSVFNGLNEVEQAALTVLRRGPLGFGDLFREVTGQENLRRHGMGDRQFAACLRRLVPIVRITGATVMSAEIDLTPQGSAVDTGELDWLALHAIDAWLGGVHLVHGGPIWRWDDARARLVIPGPPERV